MKEVVVYKRLSPTGDSKERIKEKLTEQERKAREHCDEQDKEVVRVFEDRLVSGRKKEPMEREAFGEMIEFIVENDISEIVVSKKNRNTRIAVIGLAIREYAAAAIWGLTGEYWKPDVYAVEEDQYVQSFTDLEEATAGDIFGALADYHGDQDSAHSDARSTQITINHRQEEYRPTGKSPGPINSNRVILGDESSYYYLPEDEGEFARAIGILNAVARDNNKSNYQIGKEHGFESNPGVKTDNIERNAWKFYQAYCAARELDDFSVPDEGVGFENLLEEQGHRRSEVLEHAPTEVVRE